jgi:hypothetical protein
LRASFLVGLERTVDRAAARLGRVIEGEARRKRKALKVVKPR